MRLFPKVFGLGFVPGMLAFVSAMSAAAPLEESAPEPFRAIRVQDQLMLSVGLGFMTFNETIVLKPIDVKKSLQPGKPNLFHLLIPPLWLKDGATDRPAFATLRPYYQSTHGRVRRFALLRPDGERIVAPDRITPDCRYVLTLEFGHVIPEKFTVTVGFSSSSGITPNVEFLYTASNDGYPVRSGPPETVMTDLRISAEAPLQPWKVLQGDNVLPRVTPYVVRLDRELNHVIRFGQE